ncbi:MAG TPA: hypothetical protein VGE04_07590 [Chloroflexia bacterium]
MRVAGVGANRGFRAAVLVVSLALVLWGGWSLISGFPNYDALQAVAAPLSTAEVELPLTPTRLDIPEATPIAGGGAPSPTRAGSVPLTPDLVIPLTPPMGGIPTPPRGDNPTPTQIDGEPAPIQREGEFAYPRRMQVDRPATVRLTVFTTGYNPISGQNSEVSRSNLSLPGQTEPGVTVRISAELEVDGADVTKEPANGTQTLSDLANKWEWQITAQESQEVQLRPVIRVQYMNEAGKVQYRYEVPWNDIYKVTDVQDEGTAPVIGSWLGDNLISLLGLVMGVPGTIATVVGLRKNNNSG